MDSLIEWETLGENWLLILFISFYMRFVMNDDRCLHGIGISERFGFGVNMKVLGFASFETFFGTLNLIWGFRLVC